MMLIRRFRCLICNVEVEEKDLELHFSKVHEDTVEKYMKDKYWDSSLKFVIGRNIKEIGLGDPRKVCHVCGITEPESYDKFDLHLIYCDECKQYACRDHMRYKCRGCHARICINCKHDCPDRHGYTG